MSTQRHLHLIRFIWRSRIKPPRSRKKQARRGRRSDLIESDKNTPSRKAPVTGAFLLSILLR